MISPSGRNEEREAKKSITRRCSHDVPSTDALRRDDRRQATGDELRLNRSPRPSTLDARRLVASLE
jgi:hypothetical protein